MALNECIKCKHKWTNRIEKPLCCPKCKRYDWEEKVKLQIKQEILRRRNNESK